MLHSLVRQLIHVWRQSMRLLEEFLALLVFDTKVPQFQFIDRVVDIPVLRAETCTHSANCAEDRRDSTGAVLGQCLRLASVVSASVRHPSLTRSTPSTSCVCHPSVALV